MKGTYDNMILISGNSNPDLAIEIGDLLDTALCSADIGTFSDGEISVKINDSVRGCDCFVIQSTCTPVNNNLMEMLIIIDALKRASAGRINAVIPYYGYARQDRKEKSRVPITAKLVADMLTTAGADRVICMDLHADQIQGFFDVPVDRLVALPIIAKYFKEKNIEDLVVVSPDVGSVKRSRSLAEFLNVPLAIIDKRRPEANVAEVMNVIGDIENKNVIMIDDMIDTAGTITNAASAMVRLGAKEVYAACTHAILSGPAIERLKDAKISELIVTNTISLGADKMLPNTTVLSVASLIAKAIDRIHKGKSVSILFE